MPWIENNNTKVSSTKEDFVNPSDLSDIFKPEEQKISEFKEQVDNNTTRTKQSLSDLKNEILLGKNDTKFKLQVKKDILGNPDFSDWNIPEEIQKQSENDDEISNLKNEIKEIEEKINSLDKSNFENFWLLADLKRSKENIQYQIDMIKAQSGEGNLFPEKI